MVSNGTQTQTNPLKKVGALDNNFKFEETTPVIGREYPDLDLVNDVLNASNADELIRDLAITSTFPTHYRCSIGSPKQFLSEALFSFAHRTILQTIFRNSLSIVLDSSLTSPPTPNFISTQC